MRHLIFIIFFGLSLMSCNRFYVEEKSLRSQTASELAHFSPSEQRIKAIRNISISLARRLPSDEEMQLAETTEGFKKVVQKILESNDFRSTFLNIAQSDFEMAGSANNINYNEPANLATYLAVNNLDYRNLLLADYCINDSLEKVPCSSFPSASATQMYGAGALTTQGFLEKWQSAFNFRRTSKAFRMFACKSYPDKDDQGITVEQVSTKIKTFNCTTCVPKCYDCHRNMNPRASLFYTFDRKGKFNTNPNPNPAAGEITVTDTNTVSTIDDLLAAGTRPVYHGKEVSTLKDYAEQLAQSDDFKKCTTQRIVGRLFGLPIYQELPSSLSHFYDELAKDEFKLKDFILRVATSEEFLGR